MTTTIAQLAPVAELGSAAQVHQALSRLLTLGNSATWEARESVEGYVRLAKELAMPPEDVLIRLKRIVTVSAVSVRASWRSADELTDQVIGWFLEAYF
jgi:hypothetical protein